MSGTAGETNSMTKDETQVDATRPKSFDDVTETGEGGDNREKNTFGKKILRVIWDSLDKSPEERHFVAKVDCWIMTYVCVAYFVKYLDQTNVRYSIHPLCPRIT